MQRLWAFLLLALLPLVLCSQPTQEKIEVSGTIVNSVTGVVVSGALVTITVFSPQAREGRPATEGPEEKRILTDHTGKFSFVRQSDTNASISVFCDGFEPLFESAAGRGNSAQPKTLALKLTPLSVVHGRLVNEDREPIPNVHVQLLTSVVRDGRRQTSVDREMNTNDLGEYRFYDVRQGDYYARAGGRNQSLTSTFGLARLPESDSTFANLYYPSAARVDGAQAIHVTPGMEFRADFQLQEQRAFRIRGQLKGFTFTVGSRPTLRLLAGEEALANRSVLQANGAFEVSDVTPGRYVVQVYSTERNQQLLGEAPVAVQDRDVSGLEVALGGAAEVRGTVMQFGSPMVEDSMKVFANRAFRTSIRAVPRAATLPPNLASPANAFPDANGQFTLKVFPGVYDLQVSAPGYYVSALQSGNQDVLADGLTVGPGGAEIKIALTSGGATIQGKVENAPSDPRSRTQVLLLRKLGASVIPQVIYAFNGSFVAANLAAGEYSVLLLPAGHEQEIEYRNPAVVQGLSSGAVTLFLRDGVTEEVTLKMAKETP